MGRGIVFHATRFYMWYFLIKQCDADPKPYRALQKQASLTEVELFSEPYEDWYIFSVERDNYSAFVDLLDQEGISYELAAERPTRAEMIAHTK